MNEQEYTKHYYAGSERVCTKIGSGFSLAPTAPVGTQQVEAINEQNPEEISNGLWTMVARGIECTEFNPAYVMLDKKLEPAYNMGDGEENDRYFYHSDHLGSSAFVTGVAGHAIQHLQYLPFGELFADQRHDSPYHTPYKFSAKEKDEESGYSYFGARYYDSDLSVWLSVDPLAGKYPFISPYNYCFNQPIRFVDPNGEDGIDRARKYQKRHGGTLVIWKGKHGRQYSSVDWVDKNGNVHAKVFRDNIIETIKKNFLYFIPNFNVKNNTGQCGEKNENERHESRWKDWNFDITDIMEFLEIFSINRNSGYRKIITSSGAKKLIPDHGPNNRNTTDDNNNENYVNPGLGAESGPETVHKGTIKYKVPALGNDMKRFYEGEKRYENQKDSSNEVEKLKRIGGTYIIIPASN